MPKKKKKNTYYKKLGLVSIGLFFFITIGLVATIQTIRSQTPETTPVGWAWNAYQFADSDDAIGLGWTSINCLNDFDNDGELENRCNTTRPYGLYVEDGGDGFGGFGPEDVKGCAWSSAYGWVCFNSGSGSGYQCDKNVNSACNALGTNGVSIVAHSSGFFHQLVSPAWSGSDWGATTVDNRAAILSLYESTAPEKSYVGFPFRENATTTDNTLIGCFGCDSSTGSCNACLNVSTEPEDVDENPSPNILCWGCSSCTISRDGGSCSVNKTANSCDPASCTTCTDYPGVVVNEFETQRYEMCGWGYHAYEEDSVRKGLGWIAFSSETAIGDTAYIDVQEGSLLSGGNIFSPGGPPVGQYNAAYILEASGDITNWYSENAFLFDNVPGLPEFLQQQGTGVYRNVLGKLDYEGIITDVTRGRPLSETLDAANRFGVNKYGRPIGLNQFYTSAVAADDSVFHYDCDGGNDSEFEIPWTGAPDTVIAGSGNTSGAAVGVIDCDLRISGDMFYDDTGATRLRHVPSLVWIVRGDVIIDPTVEDIVGTFIVLGDDSVTACPALNAGGNGCGRFSTGESDQQLRVRGTVMAKQFDFERSFSTGGAPSEQFIPEGRLQANPPSGLTDFAQSVPRFTSGN